MKSHEITVFADLIPSNSPQKNLGGPCCACDDRPALHRFDSVGQALTAPQHELGTSNRYYWLILEMD